MLTRSVVPFRRSRTNTSEWPFVSPGTRLSLDDQKATKRPCAESVGGMLLPAALPSNPTLTNSVEPFRRSWMRTSQEVSVSFGTRLVACDLKATKRPSSEIATGSLPLMSLPCLPRDDTLTRSVLPAQAGAAALASAISPAAASEARPRSRMSTIFVPPLTPRPVPSRGLVGLGWRGDAASNAQHHDRVSLLQMTRNYTRCEVFATT